MAIFEDSMADLASHAVSAMLQRGPESNYFVYRSSESQKLRVLGIYRSVITVVVRDPVLDMLPV